MKHVFFIFLVVFLGMNLFSQENIVDDGFSSDFHKTNTGKILFSPTEVLFQQENLNSYTNEFNWGDPIYGRLFWSEGLNKIYQKNGWSTEEDYIYQIVFTLNGKLLDSYIWNTKGERTTKPICLYPDENDYYEWDYKNVLNYYLSKFSTGKNTVKIEFFAYDFMNQKRGELLCEGSFNLNVKQEQINLAKQFIFTNIETRWSSGNAWNEWNIYLNNKSGSLKTQWSDDKSKWNFSLTGINGTINTKWTDDFSSWTLVSDNETVEIKQKWSNDWKQWEISDGSSTLNVKTKWSSDDSWDEWEVSGNKGTISVKTKWSSGDDKWQKWQITDNMPTEKAELKMAAIFICIFNGIPH
ncbi:MAG: hypothetical protein JXL97_07345 [Bacteroidales bacterium]|nr:hypothetical protein [Bacteroidales bacterium]